MARFITPCEGRITSPFGYRIHPIRKRREMHWGVDYGNTPKNNNILASAGGTVRFAGVMGGYGNVILLQHRIDGETWETAYAHLASMKVKAGDTVKQGQVIGVKGTTGNSTGVHLHFEVHKGGLRNQNYTYAVDPLAYVANPEVLETQKLLNQIGENILEDGIDGATYREKVKAFQRRHGLVVDGISGNATQIALRKEVEEMSKWKGVPLALLEEFKAAVGLGLSDGSRPADNATRAEVVVMLYRLYKLLKGGK